MSSNRLTYDPCSYKEALKQSTSQLDYNLYNGKFENSAKCRIEFGTVGGNGVSLYSGNLVDLESELRGQTRQASQCSESMYKPNGPEKLLRHQPSCQLQYYPKTPMPEKIQGSTCSWGGK